MDSQLRCEIWNGQSSEASATRLGLNKMTPGSTQLQDLRPYVFSISLKRATCRQMLQVARARRTFNP